MEHGCSPTIFLYHKSNFFTVCKFMCTFAVLGTCATFSATAPLARTEKGSARRGGGNVK